MKYPKLKQRKVYLKTGVLGSGSKGKGTFMQEIYIHLPTMFKREKIICD